MWERMMAESRAMELDALGLQIQHRMEWDEARTVEKLQRALAAARSRLSLAVVVPPTGLNVAKGRR